MNKQLDLFTKYEDVLEYLYTQLPMFQRMGGAALKKDLTNTIALCEALGNPQHQFKSIHIAGTNGKGSCSHYTASILQAAGFKTGLYTSPHLKNFTERIKINGEEMLPQAVIDFVNANKALIERIKPSFFEITVAMAFDYFAKQQVEIAIIEVGMGGRLDSTNVITPEVCLITNISKDHEQWLGKGLVNIAKEKAGIIKPGVPIVVSERQDEVAQVFKEVALVNNATIYFAPDYYTAILNDAFKICKGDEALFSFSDPQIASYQTKNIPAVLKVIDVLKEMGFSIALENIKYGLQHMVKSTGLKGRWQLLSQKPKTICDVGHNEAGVRLIVEQLKKENYKHLHIVWGSVNDKDITEVLALLPKEAVYYFCQANIPRALPVDELKAKADTYGLQGASFNSVTEALKSAQDQATPDDLIFIGGSTFVVAELDQL